MYFDVMYLICGDQEMSELRRKRAGPRVAVACFLFFVCVDYWRFQSCQKMAPS